MKKLGISLVALMIGLPMAARADITPITLLGNPAGTVAANTNVATTSYVQGAYNDLAGHINTNVAAINTLNGDANTAGSVAKAVADANSAMNTRVGALETTVGDASSGLVKAVADNTSAIAGKQNTIDSTHKLDADLVDDSTSTNKFVTAEEKTKISNAVTKDVNDLTNYTTTTDMNAALGNKQDASKSTVANGTYNYISQGDGVASNLVNLDTQVKANADAIAGKATAATTLAGYGITDAYTKTEVDAKGIAVYGNWAQPTTSTGTVTLGGNQ